MYLPPSPLRPPEQMFWKISCLAVNQAVIALNPLYAALFGRDYPGVPPFLRAGSILYELYLDYFGGEWGFRQRITHQ